MFLMCLALSEGGWVEAAEAQRTDPMLAFAVGRRESMAEVTWAYVCFCVCVCVACVFSLSSQFLLTSIHQ